MFKAEKVLWGEGLFLRPQHFQLQDTYQEQRLNHTIRSTVPYPYGIKSIRFDETQLSTHILALEQIDMIWQDGEIYQAPAKDLLPNPILLDELNLRGEMLIYLALPILQPNRKNISDDQVKQPTRYHSYLNEIHDLYTDATPTEITLLKRCTEFKLFDTQTEPNQDLNGFLYLNIGKIRRLSSGHFEIDSKFIPPILHIQSNETLLANLKRTLNVIRAKIQTIQSNNRENEQKLIEFRSGDIVSFWLVNALNTAHATLNHLLQNPQIHPEKLFFE